jgi:ATP-binding cassette subfamily B multidrug efflux pump
LSSVSALKSTENKHKVFGMVFSGKNNYNRKNLSTETFWMNFFSFATTTQRSLLWSLFLKRPWSRVCVVVLSVAASAAAFAVPFYQKQFLDTLLLSEGAFSQAMGEGKMFFFLWASFLCGVGSAFFVFLLKFISFLEGSVVYAWLCAHVYQSTLNLSTQEQEKTKVGYLVSLYTTDVNTSCTLIDDLFPNGLLYFLPLVFAPVAMKMLTPLNFGFIFFVLFVVLVLNFFMAVRQAAFFSENKKFSAIRIGYANEWLQNMRIVRMLGLTALLEKKIKKARQQETQKRLLMVTNGTTMNSFGYSAPFFINICAVFVLIQQEGLARVSAGQIFALLWIFGVLLTRPLRMLPILLVTMSDCYTSAKRIEHYLQKKTEPLGLNTSSFVSCSKSQNKNSNVFLKIRGLNFDFENKSVLKNIDFDIKCGELVAIIGPVGAGKSLIFQSLLNLIPAQFSCYEINSQNMLHTQLVTLRRHFSYVPQEPFLMNASLRDNVAFEYDFHTQEDHDIRRALELAQFSLGSKKSVLLLETPLGERGVNVSGGQKQRIAIARAVFAKRPCFLLDDSLSALDLFTEKNLIQHLLFQSLSHTTRLLITHRFWILPYCDRILFVEEGQVVEQGTFQEIYDRSQRAQRFIDAGRGEFT